MKRITLLVAALVLLVLTSGFAQESTWTNPNDILFGTFVQVPRSMMSAVTNGVYYDEIDTIILSPGELSNYTGYSIFTAYGNYEYDYLGGTAYVNQFLNPFTDTTVIDGTTMGVYKLGATGELFGFRGGVLGSFVFAQDDNLNIAGGESNYTDYSATTVDAVGTVGTADYSWISSEDYTDYTAQSTYYGGAGVDLGILGASIYGFVNSSTRALGGGYMYTYTSNAATETAYVTPADAVTSKTVYYGNGEDGAVKWEPYTSSADWLLGVRGHIPFAIGDFSMPIKADVAVGSQAQTVAGVYNPAMTTSYTANNLTGITDATKTNTITQVVGQAMSTAGWDAQAAAGILAAEATYNQAAFRTLATNTALAGTAYALDPANFKNSDFIAGLDALIDPEIIVADIFSVRTRGQLGYMLNLVSQNNAGIKSVTYNESIDASADKSVYTYSESVTAPTSTMYNVIDLEFGGVMDLHNAAGTLSVSSGVFYHPTMMFGGTTSDNMVTTTNVSWIDQSLVNEVTASTDTIGPGNFEGSRTDVTTTTWADGKVSDMSSVTNNFYIPTSTKIVMAEGAVELVGGYLLQHSTTTTTTKNYTSTTTSETTALATSDGTSILPAAATASAATTTNPTSDVTKTSSAWAGQMSWMLRWNAMEGLTVDFYGASIMNALNFSVFGDDGTNTGFNPWTFVDNLGISVTISGK